MESNKNLSNLDIKVLSDIFHHLNEINQSCNLLRENFLNSTDIVDKINRSISFLNQFEDIFIYIDKERSLTKYQKKKSFLIKKFNTGSPHITRFHFAQSSLYTRFMIVPNEFTLCKAGRSGICWHAQ